MKTKLCYGIAGGAEGFTNYYPYVSDTVLKSSINREELLNNAMLRDIMVANPHSAKSGSIMQEIDMRLEPMPEYMRDEILEGVFVLSTKELMEAKRDMNMQYYNYGFNRLLSASLTDTIPVHRDTLMALLAADGSAQSLMQQAWLWLEAGDTTAAINRLASVPGEITLVGHDITDYNEQMAFMQWLVLNPVVDTMASEALTNFILSPSYAVSSAAKSILVAHNLLDYKEPYLEPDLTKSAEVKKPKAKPDSYKAASLKVYPNPANQFLTIEYNTGAGNYPAILEVIDESGRRVYYQNLGRQFDQIILDTRNFKPGNYIIRLVSGSKYIGNANVIISR